MFSALETRHKTLNLSPHISQLILACLYLLALLLVAAGTSPLNPETGFAPPPFPADDSSGPALIESHFVTRDDTRESHAASGTVDAEGRLLAVWYGGSEEGAYDVRLFRAYLGEKRWQEPSALVDVHLAQQQLSRYVRKIGNPVIFQHSGGRQYLFFVTVSAGGWAGSALNVQVSDDQGQTWSPMQRLITSPFLNISTLVRGNPFEYADGSIGLPVYHEFLGKFTELLRLSPDLEVLDKTRLHHGRASLQPEVAVLSATEAVVVMRSAEPRPRYIWASRTRDAGLSWQPPQPLSLPNPNAAVALLALGPEDLLLVFNDTQQYRRDLTLARSEDGGNSWRRLHRFEDSRDTDPDLDLQYAYPWLGRDTQGQFHLIYTWNQREIKHITFNNAWLRQVSGHE